MTEAHVVTYPALETILQDIRSGQARIERAVEHFAAAAKEDLNSAVLRMESSAGERLRYVDGRISKTDLAMEALSFRVTVIEQDKRFITSWWKVLVAICVALVTLAGVLYKFLDRWDSAAIARLEAVSPRIVVVPEGSSVDERPRTTTTTTTGTSVTTPAR